MSHALADWASNGAKGHDWVTHNGVMGDYDICRHCGSLPEFAQAVCPSYVPEPVPERPVCWSCDRELSSYLDASYSRDPVLAGWCRECRARRDRTIAKLLAEVPDAG